MAKQVAYISPSAHNYLEFAYAVGSLSLHSVEKVLRMLVECILTCWPRKEVRYLGVIAPCHDSSVEAILREEVFGPEYLAFAGTVFGWKC